MLIVYIYIYVNISGNVYNSRFQCDFFQSPLLSHWFRTAPKEHRFGVTSSSLYSAKVGHRSLRAVIPPSDTRASNLDRSHTGRCA